MNSIPPRLYLACHAPPEPASWFTPKLQPLVTADPLWRWCEGCKGDSDCDGTADCDKLRETQDQNKLIKQRNKRDAEMQWRYEWADWMLGFGGYQK